MEKNKSYWLIGIILSLMLFFIISNPTTNDLKRYRKLLPKDKVTIDRKNYFLFSIYSESGHDEIDSYHNEYIGVMGTFFVYYSAIS